MSISTTALFALVLAATLASSLPALASRFTRRPSPNTRAPWWAALAVGLAYTLAHLGLATPSFPPVDVTDRIPLLALAGATVAALQAFTPDRLTTRIAAYLGLAVLAFIVILGPVLGAKDFQRESLVWLAATALAALLATLNVALLDAPARRAELWTALIIFATGAGIVLLLANSAVLFQLSGLLALVLAASILGSWGLPLGGGVPVAAAVLTALIIEGFVYAFLPANTAILLAASPTILWLTRFGPLARLHPKARASVALALILLPLAVAVSMILSSKSSEASGY